MQFKRCFVPVVIALALAFGPATAQQAEAPDNLKVYFDTGGATIRSDQRAVLDTAAGLFREGNPIVMIVSGSADTIGNPADNLSLSLRRAQTVALGLSDRGIPIERLQVMGLGNSELVVPTDDEVANPENRSVIITWR